MQLLVKLFIFSILSFISVNCDGQPSTKAAAQTITFKVWGNCEMCKETIESALDVKGVKSAKWDQESKKITITFFPDKIAEDKLHQLIAAVGYDTEKLRGSDKAYADLPDCCHYTRKPAQ